MSSIYNYSNKCGSIKYRVVFRSVGLKTFSTTFNSKKDAEAFAKKYEKDYVLENDKFVKEMTKSRSQERRKRNAQVNDGTKTNW